MPPDYTQTPQWAQFVQGMGYDPYALSHPAYGGTGTYGTHNPYGGFMSGTAPGIPANTATPPANGSAGAIGGAIGAGATALAGDFNNLNQALNRQSQAVPQINPGLYQHADIQHYGYGGPTTGGSLAKAGTDALSGAATGASVGTAIAPGIGTAIGAGIGAIGGAAGDIVDAFRSDDLKDEWQRKVAAQQRDLTAHNANVNLYNRRTRENQAMLNGYGNYTQQALSY